MRGLSHWKLPIALDWLWRKVIYSRTQNPRHTWGESHILTDWSWKLHGLTGRDSEVTDGSLHMVCEPGAECAPLAGVTSVCAESWSPAWLLSSHGMNTLEVCSRLGWPRNQKCSCYPHSKSYQLTVWGIGCMKTRLSSVWFLLTYS